MKVLAPFVSCYLELSDTTVDGVTPLQAAINQGYTQIYFTAIDPTTNTTAHYVHHVLRSGRGGKHRFVQMKVDKIPGMEFSKAQQAVEFLPDGKIPIRLLDEVKEFFGQVIKKKGTSLEAMIWILWNETDGYHLHVPDQTVGGASASYDWASLPPDSSIIVDIHSHANFGAFFSGIDDRDDTNCIRFSGVIGHNVKPPEERDMIFRFTYYGTRFAVKMEDLFYQPVRDAVEVPEEWVDRVKTHVYQRTSSSHYFPGYSGSPHHNGSTPSSGYGRIGNGHAVGGGGLGGPIHGRPGDVAKNVTSAANASENQDDELSNAAEHYFQEMEQRVGRGGAGKQSKKSKKGLNGQGNQRPLQLDPRTSAFESSKEDGTKKEGGAQSGSPFPGLVEGGGAANGPLTHRFSPANEEDEGSLISENEENRQLLELFEEGLGADQVVRRIYAREEEVEEKSQVYIDTPNFDSIVASHSIQVALAANEIDVAVGKLVVTPGTSEILEERASDMFALVDEERKLDLFRKLYQSLPDEAREKLSQTGF